MPHKLLILLIALATSPAFAKSLYWQGLDVTASLDRDGRLHVVEKQSMVFDGDWNGGERTFRIGAGQSLRFESIARVDGGAETRLVSGDLARVDHYGFTSPTVLRWRSRLPEDPPFANREITYVLRYTVSGVLRQSGDAYLLNHDFAFSNREGVIKRFSLRLDLDPVWRGVKGPVVIARNNLAPGQSVVVPLKLEFTGANRPATAVRTLSPRTIYGILVLFAAALAYLVFEFISHESQKGRWARLLRPEDVSEAFLSQNVFAFKPEVAGAALDNKTAAPEVAAVLARLTQEGKLSSRIESRGNVFQHQVLCLKLEKEDLPDYEGKLVRKLFFGAMNTDTDRIRDHYKGKGFDPAQIIESGIASDLQNIKGWSRESSRANWKQDSMIMVAALVVLIIAGIAGGEKDVGIVISVGIFGALFLGGALVAANLKSRAVTNFIGNFAIPALLLGPIFYLVIGFTLAAGRQVLHLLTPLAICAWAAAITKVMLDALRTPESPERIAFRKNLWSARNYFVSELRSRQPRLRDDWYPYLLAFGLGKHVDRWFGAHGVAAGSAQTSSEPLLHSSSSSSTSSSPAFTGGGGAFGGAGASGGWAIAAAGMAAGVSAPSSSSGNGSSSSSSSSSSGGGGGGGW